MSEHPLYREIQAVLKQEVSAEVPERTVERLVSVVLGILCGKNASPAGIARAVHSLGLSGASLESIERRVRRFENDAQVSASLCFHPLARAHLQMGKPRELTLIIDPTMQEDKVVMLSVGVWYRGRALPLAWLIWEGNVPLKGDGFWLRVEQTLAQVSSLLPMGIPIIWLADRAFGTPTFTDLLSRYGWHFVVRVQGQTHYRTQTGQEGPISALLARPAQRTKLRGQVFKKAGWRTLSVIVLWGRKYPSPLCLVSDLPPDYALAAHYRRRYAIEASFRDFKTYGFNWERGQVKALPHLERLLVAMALAAWLALMVGTQVALELLARVPSKKRHSRPFLAKFSLFSLGLQRLDQWLHRSTSSCLAWRLSDWEHSNWFLQLTNHHRHAALFA